MRTAEALKKAAGSLYPEAEVAILDTFRYASPFLEKVVLGTYMEILKMSPVIYGYLYRQAERGQPLSGRGKVEFNRILSIVAAPRLERFMSSFRPDLVVCTHPFPLGILSYMKKRGTYTGPVFATITDFTVHSFWIFPEVDCYIIGSEALVPQCEDYEVAPGRICPTGIPIDPAFNVRYEKRRLREQLGLDPALPVILVMGGGLGMGPLASAVKTLGGVRSDYQLMVVAGTNRALQDKLNRIIPGLPCRAKVFGFVDNIHQLMAASDCMVGKAGGLTCAEALAAGLPLIIVDPLPGQEERNTEFMTAVGAGVRVKERELAGVVRACLEEPGRLEGMARAAAGLGKPRAALDAVAIMAGAV
ncbi:MAG: galactosyldiacylglycerol synthase [Peptococcaceae bacterium]|nr:galactosyldiacylglycerol synthase [Peptococcaceae bacterium]